MKQRCAKNQPLVNQNTQSNVQRNNGYNPPQQVSQPQGSGFRNGNGQRGPQNTQLNHAHSRQAATIEDYDPLKHGDEASDSGYTDRNMRWGNASGGTCASGSAESNSIGAAYMGDLSDVSMIPPRRWEDDE